jgi:NAD(P)H-hydrate repair Nnr-like enzyme with NAD(P)H-hydrate dehydratase domain
VLKGARTVICDGTAGDEHCSINPTGTSALATAGSGDVLAGTIGALLAQGLSALDAARTGVYAHGAASVGYPGMLISSDLPERVGAYLNAAHM